MRRPASLHRALEATVRAFNRNPWSSHRLELVPRRPGPTDVEPADSPDPPDAVTPSPNPQGIPEGDDGLYAEDGLWTIHVHAFLDDPRFDHAYARAIQAGGFDYRVRWRAHTILWGAATAATAEGAFVECGTGRGFMASAICDYLHWTTRPFWLFDTFLPTEPDQSGEQKEDGYACSYYASGIEAVARNFEEWPGVQLVEGRIPDTLTDEIAEVAFLHVDLNNAAAEEAAIRHFWPRMSAGAVMVLDDYGFVGYEAQHEAADRLGDELGFEILAVPTGQGLVTKIF